MLPDPVQDTLHAAQHASTSLQTLAIDFTLETRATLPETQFTALHQTLETLQATLMSIWPLVRMQTEHPLLPFALVAQEQLAALRGTLWGLRTGTPEAWATLPVPVARALQTAMTTLLTDWQTVATTMQTLPSSPPAAQTPPRAMPQPWGSAVAQA
jgi:hypothetical protein